MTPEEKVAMLKKAGVWDVIGFPSCIDKLFDLVAAHEREKQAEQEPVAWRWPTHNGYAYAETHFDDEGGEPLYAAPVRTKDLTDDDQMSLDETIMVGMANYIDKLGGDSKGFRAVIAKYKEKNK